MLTLGAVDWPLVAGADIDDLDVAHAHRQRTAPAQPAPELLQPGLERQQPTEKEYWWRQRAGERRKHVDEPVPVAQLKQPAEAQLDGAPLGHEGCGWQELGQLAAASSDVVFGPGRSGPGRAIDLKFIQWKWLIIAEQLNRHGQRT